MTRQGIIVKCPSAPCVPDGSQACPFVAFADAAGLPAGLYWFEVNGTPVELYADGDGFVMVASSTQSGHNHYNLITLADPPVNRWTNTAYDQASMTQLSSMATTVKIIGYHYNQVAISSDNVIITRLQNYRILSCPSCVELGSDHWTGDTATLDLVNPGPDLPFDRTIYDAVRNSAGTRWGFIPAQNADVAVWRRGGIIGDLGLFIS